MPASYWETCESQNIDMLVPITFCAPFQYYLDQSDGAIYYMQWVAGEDRDWHRMVVDVQQ